MPAPDTNSSPTRLPLSTGRLLSFDLIRGLAVLTIVVIHRVHYSWTGMADRETLHRVMEVGGLQNVVIVIIIILFTMGGLFYVVSGSVNAYAGYRAIASHRHAPGFIFWRNTKTGLFLIILSIAHRVLFGNGFAYSASGGEPEYVTGLITGWLKYGEPVPFRWSLVTEPGTLSIIGIILLVNTGLMAAVHRRRGLGDGSTLARVFLFSGIGILLTYPFLKLGLTPLYEQMYAGGRYLEAWILGHLCLEFGIAPHLAFGLFGALTGILLSAGTDRECFTRRVRTMTYGLIGAGALITIVAGSVPVIADRLTRAGISIFGLGLFLFIELIALHLWDWRRRDAAEPPQRSWLVERLRLFGRFSLTVFVFEGLLAEILAQSLSLAIGTGWMDSLWAVLGFTLLPVAVWTLLLSWWSRIQFDGPLEGVRRLWNYRAR
jgi:hypothetical protein